MKKCTIIIIHEKDRIVQSTIDIKIIKKVYFLKRIVYIFILDNFYREKQPKGNT